MSEATVTVPLHRFVRVSVNRTEPPTATSLRDAVFVIRVGSSAATATFHALALELSTVSTASPATVAACPRRTDPA